MSDSISPKKKDWRRFFAGKFLFISILLHILGGLGATYYVVQTIEAKRKLTFQGGPASPNRSTRALEHKVQMARKTNSMSAPAQTRRITTTGLSKVSLPDMPAMPGLSEVPPTKMAGMGGSGIGFAGGSGGGGGGGQGNGRAPFFGFREPKGGGSLIGTFYDLKQGVDGKPTGMNEEQYGWAVSSFVTKGWKKSELDRFFHGSKPLYATQIYIPLLDANEGPKAFDLADKVQPKMWVVHYKGKVIPPESGNYRFAGVADDLLVVRFRGKNILDSGSFFPTGNGPSQFYPSEGTGIGPHLGWYKGLGMSDTFSVVAGNSYELEILIGERPGGQFKAYLLIEKVGAEYKKDNRGQPVLPIFKIAASEVPTGSPDAPVFEEDGPIWKAEKEAGPAKSIFNSLPK